MMRTTFITFLISINSFAFYSSAKQTDNYLDIAVMFKEEGNYEKAIEVLKTTLKDRDGRLINYLGKLYYLNGDVQRAIMIFKNNKEKDWFTFLYLGLCYEDTGDVNLAASNYLKSLKLKETSIALYQLGKIYYKDEEYNKAKDYFFRTISLDSSIRLAHYYLGECFLKIADFEQAYKYLSKAVNFYPGRKNIHASLLAAKNGLDSDFFAKAKSAAEKKREKIKLAYYPKEEGEAIKVGIAKNLDEFTFKGGKFIITCNDKVFHGNEDAFYTIKPVNHKFILFDRNGSKNEFEGALEIRGDKPFYIVDVTYGRGDYWHKRVDRIYRGNLEVIIRDGKITLINILSIEEYLYGVLSSEIPSSSPMETLKAQAVAARTIAYKSMGRHKKDGFDVCSDVHCQVYQGISVETPLTTLAINVTRGEIITYRESIIYAFYHADCGGCFFDEYNSLYKFDRRKNDDIIVSDKSNQKDEISLYKEELWFINGGDTFCSDSGSSFRWQRVYDEADFLLAFGFKLGDIQGILPLDKDECFHNKTIEVVKSRNKETLRQDLPIRNYFDKLRSNAFKVEIKRDKQGKAKKLILWGAGFGHGMGMCQEGAIAMGKEGYTYKDILSHYYSETKVKKIDDGR